MICVYNFYNISYETMDIKDIKDTTNFLNKEELYNILSNHHSFYKKLFKTDLTVRNVSSIPEYISMISKAVGDYKDEDKRKEKNKIERCISMASTHLENIDMEWFSKEKSRLIRWNIGCVEGSDYEMGLPHTVDHIMIIPIEIVRTFSDERLTRTLIHEKVHIYQKMYPQDVDKYIDSKSFIKVRKRTESDRIRANPDIDDWIYMNKEENRIYSSIYVENPKSITDTTTRDQRYEHPFEQMAIDISEM